MEIVLSSIGGGVIGLVRTVMTLIGMIVPAILEIAAETVRLVHAYILLLVVILIDIGFSITMLFVPMQPPDETAT